MSQDDLNSLIYLPNGTLNASYLLANAQVLLKAREFKLAHFLFQTITEHPKLGYCAYFGIAQCHLEQNELIAAKKNLEKALSIHRAPFVALSLLEVLFKQKNYSEGEKRSLQFAIEFSNEKENVENFRKYYLKFNQHASIPDRPSY